MVRMISVYTLIRMLPVCISLVAITSCASFLDRLPIVYEPQLRQGTVLEEESVAQLEPGMSPRQVRFLLGAPSLEDPFSTGRWDYVHYVDPRSDDVEPVSRRLTVFFDEDDELIGARGAYIDEDHPLHQGGQAASEKDADEG